MARCWRKLQGCEEVRSSSILKCGSLVQWSRSGAILSKSWSSWSTNSAVNLEFSAERLTESAKTISLSSWKLPILQCVQVQVQEALKSLAEKPKISDQHVLGFRSFDILLSNDPCLRLFIDIRTFVVKFFVAIYALFPQIFLDWNWKAKSADFYTFRMYGVHM